MNYNNRQEDCIYEKTRQKTYNNYYNNADMCIFCLSGNDFGFDLFTRQEAERG